MLAVVLHLSAPICRGASKILRLEGSLRYNEFELLPPEGKNGPKLLSYTNEYDFTAWVSNDSWKIRTSLKKKSELIKNKNLFDATETGSDGSFVYHLYKRFASDNLTNNAVGLMLPGNVPVGLNHISIIWLALCSGTYLSEASTNSIPFVPYGIMPLQTYDETFRGAEWKFIDSDTPLFPSLINYYSQKAREQNAIGRYAVDFYTNVSGIIFPKRFLFENRHDGQEFRARSAGVVTSMEEEQNTTAFLPKLTGPTAISDMRFATNRYVMVPHLTNQWPGVETTLSSELYKTIADLPPQAYIGNNKSLPFLFGLIFLITISVFPVAYILLVGRKGKKTQTKIKK